MNGFRYSETRGERTGIKQDEAIRSDQINAAAARLRREQEHDLARRRIVKLVDELLPLRDCLRAVETEPAEPGGVGEKEQKRWSAQLEMLPAGDGERSRAPADGTHFLLSQSLASKSSVEVKFEIRTSLSSVSALMRVKKLHDTHPATGRSSVELGVGG